MPTTHSGLQDGDDDSQMSVASFEEGLLLRCRQLLRRAIAAAAFQKGQGAIVHHNMPGEESPRRPESPGEQAPEPPSADLRTRAGESGHGPPWVLLLGFADGPLDPQPVVHGSDFAKGHARLHHSKRARVHAEEHDALACRREVLQVGLVGRPSVDQRVIDMDDRWLESQPAGLRPEQLTGGNQGLRDGGGLQRRGSVPLRVLPALPGPVQLVQLAAEDFEFLLVSGLLPLRQFECFQNLFHIFQGGAQRLDDTGDVVNGLLNRGG